MKIGGQVVEARAEEILVLPRGDKKIVFKAKPVVDFKPFNDLVPEPVRQVVLMGDGSTKPDPEDRSYQASVARRDQLRMDWLVITSLQPSEIEWVTVVEDQPSTWTNWESDLRDHGGFLNREINLIGEFVLRTNALDDKAIEAARSAFLAGQQ